MDGPQTMGGGAGGGEGGGGGDGEGGGGEGECTRHTAPEDMSEHGASFHIRREIHPAYF